MFDWRKITNDPTDIKMRKQFLKYLNKIYLGEITDIFRFVSEKFSGKRVLDIGIIQHTIESMEHPNWKHKVIKESAEYVLGIDILVTYNTVS